MPLKVPIVEFISMLIFDVSVSANSMQLLTHSLMSPYYSMQMSNLHQIRFRCNCLPQSTDTSKLNLMLGTFSDKCSRQFQRLLA